MSVLKCVKCGKNLTQEMIDSNMCWECGKILDETLLDEDTLNQIFEQETEVDPFKREEIKNHKLTTGINFEGEKITSYMGIVSGEAVIGTGFLSDIKANFSDIFGAESRTYSKKLKQAKRAALYDMICESIDVGGNAIIGISYNCIVFSGNMIGITVNGTSVKVER